MNHGQPIRRLGFPLLLSAALIACVALTTGPVGAAENVSADAVASGLQKIEDIAAGSAAAAGKDSAKAERLQAGIEPVWEQIEGTVKANDSGAYAALEDSFTLLKIAAKAGDPSKATEASDQLSSVVEGYLARHPGEAAARTAAAAPSTASAAAEGPAADAGAPAGTLARTGSTSGTLGGLAGAALGLGGLAVIGGARRRSGRA